MFSASSISATLRRLLHPSAPRVRHPGRVRHVLGEHRPVRLDQRQHLPLELGVVREPLPHGLVLRPARHLLQVQRQVAGRPHRAAQLEQHAVRDRVVDGTLPVLAPEPRPGDEVHRGRHRRRRVHREERQVLHQVHQVDRTPGVEQLGAQRDPARLLDGEPMRGHAARIRKDADTLPRAAHSTFRRAEP
jgi:hypothetical protein